MDVKFFIKKYDILLFMKFLNLINNNTNANNWGKNRN